MFKPKPKSTDQILSGMNTLLHELEASGAQNAQLKQANEERMAKIQQENEDLDAELKRNVSVTAKFRGLLA